MNETYQEQKESEKLETPEFTFATIAAIYADGVTLIFDGQTEATEKRYKCNSFVVFAVGQRVKIVKDSGTYVVEYPIGNPRTSFTVNNADYASNAGALNNKSESQLEVLKSNKLQDQDTSYRTIDFKVDSSGNHYIRNSTWGTWKKISVT